MTLDAYLTPRSDTAPSGENLEYDPAFAAMELAATASEERQIGSEVIAAQEPDYRAVEEHALSVLERSHDLRAAVALAKARLKMQGLEGFAGVTGYVRRCLEDYWDTCFPQLDPDDDNDPTMRITAVLGLSESNGALKLLRLTPLTDSPSFGRITLRDIAVLEGEIPKPEDAPSLDATQVSGAFRDTRPDLLAARLAAARAALADSQAISAVFDQRTPGDGPDLGPLIRLLKKAVGKLADAVGEPEVVQPEADEPEPAQAAGNAAPKQSAPGTISTARDVEAALDRIMEYYRVHEPSSPVPILLGRARRLIGADFLTAMNDLAPAGLESVRMIGGIKDS